jgi:hypothetical protein
MEAVMSEIVVIIRPSFMKFCEDGCRAALFNHLLYWIAKKAKGESAEKMQSGEITYYATTEELIECLAGAWGREKIRVETNNLVEMGLIGRGKNLKHGADRTKHFYFGEEQCRKLFELCQKHGICLACLGLDGDIEHLIKTVKQNPNLGNAKPESVICFTCPKHEHYPNLGLAKPESGQALTKITTKTVKPKRESKEGKPAPSAETSNSSQPDASSSLSSQKSSEETKPTEVDYPLFDRLCQGKGYAADFKVPRNEKNNAAIQDLRSQSATPEQVDFVFNDIWDDKDPFWQQHRGKPSTVASQFTARVWKMTTPAPKRQTASGFTNWTEDKTVGAVPSAPKATEKPKEPSLPVGYTRLKIDKPRGPRSLQARLEAQKKGEQQ